MESQVERVNIVKMSILPKLTYRCNKIPINIQQVFFIKIEKLILKFIWKWKGHRIPKIIFKKNKGEGLVLQDLYL